MRALRDRLTYANVVATVALFIALGGSSYAALNLPRNSVGAKQIKSKAVGKSEIRSSAVRSPEIRNGAIGVVDLSTEAQTALRGAPGPPGPAGVALRAAVSSSGALIAGNATASDPAGAGKRLVSFARSASGCTPVATLARNAGGSVSNPGPGRIVVAVEGSRVAVETYDAGGTKTNLPFNLLVAC
jgi:hypothetical protein